MAEDRQAVNLRVDTESDYYKNVIAPLKESRQFSVFIVDLIKAYNDSEVVKTAVDSYIMNQNPFDAIYKELEELQRKQAKMDVDTSLAKDQLEISRKQIVEKLSKAVGVDVEVENNKVVFTNEDKKTQNDVNNLTLLVSSLAEEIKTLREVVTTESGLRKVIEDKEDDNEEISLFDANVLGNQNKAVAPEVIHLGSSIEETRQTVVKEEEKQPQQTTTTPVVETAPQVEVSQPKAEETIAVTPVVTEKVEPVVETKSTQVVAPVMEVPKAQPSVESMVSSASETPSAPITVGGITFGGSEVEEEEEDTFKEVPSTFMKAFKSVRK